jgi:RND family efflux transporter MFP subunit
MRSFTPAILLLALIAAGCSGAGDDKKVGLPKADGPAEPITAVSPVKLPATMGAAADTNQTFSGTIEAQRTSSVATRVSGLVRKVHVTEGDLVKAGALLVEINTDDLRLRVSSASATVERLQAQVRALKVQHDRLKLLLEKNAIPQSDFDSLDGQLSVAQAGVKEAEVGLRMARSALSDSQIRAPYTGVVTNVNVAEGAYAAAGPSPLLSLEESTALRLRVQLPERFASQVKVGVPLLVRMGDQEVSFPITHINPSINPRTRSFSVLAEIDNSALTYRAGMFIEARLGATK